MQEKKYFLENKCESDDYKKNVLELLRFYELLNDCICEDMLNLGC